MAVFLRRYPAEEQVQSKHVYILSSEKLSSDRSRRSDSAVTAKSRKARRKTEQRKLQAEKNASLPFHTYLDIPVRAIYYTFNCQNKHFNRAEEACARAGHLSPLAPGRCAEKLDQS